MLATYLQATSDATTGSSAYIIAQEIKNTRRYGCPCPPLPDTFNTS